MAPSEMTIPILLIFGLQFMQVVAMTREQIQNIAMTCVIGAFCLVVIVCVTVYCYLSRKQAREIDEKLFGDDAP